MKVQDASKLSSHNESPSTPNQNICDSDDGVGAEGSWPRVECKLNRMRSVGRYQITGPLRCGIGARHWVMEKLTLNWFIHDQQRRRVLFFAPRISLRDCEVNKNKETVFPQHS